MRRKAIVSRRRKDVAIAFEMEIQFEITAFVWLITAARRQTDWSVIVDRHLDGWGEWMFANANNTRSDGVERPIITTKKRIEMRSKKKKHMSKIYDDAQ